MEIYVKRGRRVQRIIFHIDMDAFFAAVEQHDNPELKGKPVVVGADPVKGSGRGVVSAASYEARKFGIHSAMPISRAFKLCPKAVFLPVRMKRYKEVSKIIMSLFYDFTPLVEQISVDEAFLDMTGTERLLGDPVKTGMEIKQKIKEITGLTASVGIAPSKLVAKIASDSNKPDGLVFVDKDKVQEFLNPLPISRLWGVGKVTEKKLKNMGINIVKDLVNIPEKSLTSVFGKSKGVFLYNTCRGIDNRAVERTAEAKSISNEITFDNDTCDRDFLLDTILALCEKVAFRMRKQKLSARTVFLKIRYDDFSTSVRNKTFTRPLSVFEEIYNEICTLFETFYTDNRKVRLIGVGVSMLVYNSYLQQNLLSEKKEKTEKAAVVVDKIKEKYGEKIIFRAGSKKNFKKNKKNLDLK